ncbi:VOC family protein [Micromonospora eburnea]|uniref:Glyoxalase-like domain-containing protein n=1 Tax=Micromonospora eburnea TaxID=227316 RepID=A0A1C6U8A0_9ACTN|nr:VOC family protein [Micromonospora eburnea]SCL50242.1 Glyoxalase-like domain-containing protein [Micromonospora eburnea]
MPALAELATIVIDCAEPGPLAAFYRTVTGWEVTYSDADCVYLGGNAAIQLGFQHVAGYQPPTWPDPAKHAHLDFKVADIDHTVKELLALGATKPEFQPGGDEWTVLTDPAGHPFCLAAGL